MRLSRESIIDAYNAIEEAEHGDKRAVAERIAQSHNISYATLRRYINKCIKTSSKTSARENIISAEYINIIADIKLQGIKMGAAPRQVRTDDAIEIAEQAGLVPAGLLNRSTVDRRLRELGFNKDRVYQRYEDEYVNQRWYIDHSRSEYFEFCGYSDEGEVLIKVDGRRSNAYKNKEGDGSSNRLWCTMVVDSYSRLSLLYYDVVTGENQTMIKNVLQHCFNREDSTHPMIYLPESLQFDQGAIAKKTSFKTRMAEIGIKVETAASKSNRLRKEQSQGKVERRFRTLWQRELKWALVLKHKAQVQITLDELNAMAHAYMIELAQKKHPIYSKPIMDVYLDGIAIRENRTLDTPVGEVIFDTYSRRVNQLSEITLKGTLYKVPEQYVNQMIEVYKSVDGQLKGRFASDVFELKQFDPTSTVAKHRLTTQEQLKQDLELDLSNMNVQNLHKAEHSNVTRLDPRVNKEEVESVFTPKPTEATPIRDWQQAKTAVGEIFGHRYSDLPANLQRLITVAFERDMLTDDILIEMNQNLKTA